MASTETKNAAPTVDAAFEQLKGLNGQFVDAGRQAGTLGLDAVEKGMQQTIELQLKIASMTQQDWLKDLIEKQADVTRQVTSSYTSTARNLLK
jgi:hypothetical protein